MKPAPGSILTNFPGSVSYVIEDRKSFTTSEILVVGLISSLEPISKELISSSDSNRASVGSPCL